MAKLKQYYLTTLINDVEVDITCATNSKKNFAAILGKSPSYVNDYASNGIEIEECMANPHKLYCKRGLGGETLDIFEKGKIYEYDAAAAMIKEHRKTYANHREWHERKAK
jgi:hypothetical protein